jgi:type IV secretory pathway component VirB8
MIVDRIDLQGHIRDVSPIWYDHLVFNYVFDRKDWRDDATEEQIAEVKAFYDSRNTTRLEDFIAEHNSSFQDTAMYERLANNMAY